MPEPKYIDCSPDTWLTVAANVADHLIDEGFLLPDHKHTRDSILVAVMLDVFRTLCINAPAVRAGSRACGGCNSLYRPDTNDNHEPQGDTGGI